MKSASSPASTAKWSGRCRSERKSRTLERPAFFININCVLHLSDVDEALRDPVGAAGYLPAARGAGTAQPRGENVRAVFEQLRLVLAEGEAALSDGVRRRGVLLAEFPGQAEQL